MSAPNTQKAVIFGSAGHAKVVIDILERGQVQIVGLLDSYKKKGVSVMGYTVVGDENEIPNILKEHPNCKFFVAIGDNWIRHQITERILAIAPKMEAISAIHPNAIIGKNVKIGKGVAVMPGAIVNTDSVLGDFTIVNTKASLDHEGHLGKFSSLAPNVSLGGNVHVGDYSAVCIGSVVIHGKRIGSHTVVGAQALLLTDCEDNTVYYGNPAKRIRSREAGDSYL